MLLIELLTESTMSRVCYWLYREYFRAFANGTPDWFIPDVSSQRDYLQIIRRHPRPPFLTFPLSTHHQIRLRSDTSSPVLHAPCIPLPACSTTRNTKQNSKQNTVKKGHPQAESPCRRRVAKPARHSLRAAFHRCVDDYRP